MTGLLTPLYFFNVFSCILRAWAYSSGWAIISPQKSVILLTIRMELLKFSGACIVDSTPLYRGAPHNTCVHAGPVPAPSPSVPAFSRASQQNRGDLPHGPSSFHQAPPALAPTSSRRPSLLYSENGRPRCRVRLRPRPGTGPSGTDGRGAFQRLTQVGARRTKHRRVLFFDAFIWGCCPSGYRESRAPIRTICSLREHQPKERTTGGRLSRGWDV